MQALTLVGECDGRKQEAPGGAGRAWPGGPWPCGVVNTAGADMDAGALVLVLSSWSGDLCCSLAQTRSPRAPPLSLGGARLEKPLRVPPSRWDPVHSSAPDKRPVKAGACLSGLPLGSQHLGQGL